MAHHRNHQRFTIKCLKNDIIPVSVRLKTNIHTTKGLEIIKRAEKQLLNECVRSINNQLEMSMIKRDACSLKLKGLLDQKTIEECAKLIRNVVECRHNRVLERQKSKFDALYQQKIGGCSNKVYHTDNIHVSDGSNNTEETKKWVINLSNTPLTENQERLLAWGPKFVIRPRHPPVEEYIAAVEKACPKLEQREANELRVEVKKALKKSQKAPRVPSNITREVAQALKELRKDKSRIILTTDKGVALVVMNKADYITKSEELLDTTTYKRSLKTQPTDKKIN